MQCGLCGQQMAHHVRGYPQREQLDRHMWVAHRLNVYISGGKRKGYAQFIPEVVTA